jgi:hypothetical protein
LPDDYQEVYLFAVTDPDKLLWLNIHCPDRAIPNPDARLVGCGHALTGISHGKRLSDSSRASVAWRDKRIILA